MSDLLGYKIFYMVAKTNSISKTAEIYNLSRTAVSKRIFQLEREFRQKLFIRTNNGICLAESGKTLFSSVSELIKNYNKVNNQFLGAQQEKNTLSIITTHSLVTLVLSEVSAEFSRKHPDIKLKIIAQDEDIDLLSTDSDLSLQPKILNHNEIRQEKFFQWEQGLYASPEYLKQRGTPINVSDLKKHQFIIFGNEEKYPYGLTSWPLMHIGKDRSNIVAEVNSVEAMIKLAEKGMGITALSQQRALHQANLVRVLPDFSSPTFETYITYSVFKKDIPLLKNFIQHMKAYIKDNDKF